MKYIDDIAIDKSASYKRKYILARLQYICKIIFHKHYERQLQKAVDKYEKNKGK